jgi:hypothetical protein
LGRLGRTSLKVWCFGMIMAVNIYLQRLQFELLKNLYVLYDGAPQWSV